MLAYEDSTNQSNLGHYYCQVGIETDIGGGRENQDDSFVWRCGDMTVIGILDGHGREIGKIAAQAAKRGFIEYLEKNYNSFAESPEKFLAKSFDSVHFYIRDTFAKEITSQGFQVSEDPSGFLLKRRSTMQNWQCIHGGTACSIVVIYQGTIWVANVGDSAGLLCSTNTALHPNLLEYVMDSSYFVAKTSTTIDETNSCPSSNLIITAEHSPESIDEFFRLRAHRSREDNPELPALLMVYDAPNSEKTNCPPVFSITQSQEIFVTKKGKYYKNVRKEWASLVSTPPYAKYQDALAFTRSLGDFHLHTYGVTHLPEIRKISVDKIFEAVSHGQSLSRIDQSTSAPLDSSNPSIICIVLATDGVWDNWFYNDLAAFVMDGSCLAEVNKSAEGAQHVAMSLIHRNSIFSRKNFGSQADNATAALIYISNHPMEEKP